MSKYRSWSHSRQQTYDVCPRRWFWEYFAWQEPEEEFARFLRRIVTPAQLAGTHVHDGIVVGLRQFQKSGHWPKDLVRHTLRAFQIDVDQSARVAGAAREDRSPDRVGAVLDVHLYGLDAATAADSARTTIVRSLDNLERSELLAFLLESDSRGWSDVATRLHQPRYFEIGLEMGFRAAHGLRVYGACDFSLKRLGYKYILDWKTGSAAEEANATAMAQLAAYAIAEAPYSRAPHLPRVQAVWLEEGAPAWRPKELTNADVDVVRRRIEAQNRLESKLLVKIPASVRKGRAVAATQWFRARREDFPPTPRESACGACKFRLLCDERIGTPAASSKRQAWEPL